MPKFNIPDRKYCSGAKKMVSMRLPEKLMRELEKLAEAKGWNVTDLVQTALDQYIAWEKKED
jgi:predicted transcriptional regulator